jgi:glucosamine--fructose-6-phosphate aminotransferase (isomerizing)
VAQEAALKLKESCGLHAEAFSSAEVKHGPMALVREGFPVLAFTQSDDTRAGIAELAAEFAARGARVMV